MTLIYAFIVMCNSTGKKSITRVTYVYFKIIRYGLMVIVCTCRCEFSSQECICYQRRGRIL